MTNKLYWDIHSVIKYFKLIYGLSKKKRIKQMKLPIDDLQIMYISHDKIEFSLIDNDLTRDSTCIIEDGSWDLKKERFKNTDTFINLKEQFTNKIPLIKTKYNTFFQKQAKEKDKIRGHDTRKELGVKCREIEEIYFDMKNTSYKSKGKLRNNNSSNWIKVAIDRNGRFLLESGKKQLAMAKILGIKNIPVIVTRRHYQWAKFRREVFLFSQETPKGTYQPLIHPGFQIIPFHRKEDRWELIEKNLTIHNGTVLDIGSNIGYFCHKFEELGFECYAAEKNYKYLYFLKKLREIEHKKFKVLSKSVFDIKTKKYDIVLSLSIFHHFLRTKKLYNKMTKFLGELDLKIMFFEPHETGYGYKHAYIDYSEIEFVNYILENSCLNNYKFLGRGERGRSLYLLS